MPFPVQSPEHYAATAARLVKADKCDTREFDDCFEMGNGRLVVVAFVRLYRKDVALAWAVARNEEYINIARWIETADQVTNPLSL